MKKLELPVYLLLMLSLSGMVAREGSRNTELQSKVQLSPKKLYARLANPQLKLQLIDVRDLSDYADDHVPGAIPYPGCDAAKLPDAAKDRIYPYVATVVLSADGDPATFERCRTQFKVAWNLAGGMTAWDGQSLPQIDGEYAAPKNSAGGGCL